MSVHCEHFYFLESVLCTFLLTLYSIWNTFFLCTGFFIYRETEDIYYIWYKWSCVLSSRVGRLMTQKHVNMLGRVGRLFKCKLAKWRVLRLCSTIWKIYFSRNFNVLYLHAKIIFFFWNLSCAFEFSALLFRVKFCGTKFEWNYFKFHSNFKNKIQGFPRLFFCKFPLNVYETSNYFGKILQDTMLSTLFK